MTKEDTFTWEEVAKHNKVDDAWLIIRDGVYDVTDWVHEHPGGMDVIRLNAGKDATQLFEAYHQVGMEDQLPPFRIGKCISTEIATFPPMSPFYKTLKKRVQSYFEKEGIDPKNAPWMHVRAILITIATFTIWCLGWNHFSSYTNQEGIISPFAPFYAWPLLCLTCALTAWGVSLLGFMPGHEGSHMSTSHSTYMWRIQGMAMDYMFGGSYYMWMHQHFLGHHPYTNIDEADPDIVTGDPDVRRIKPMQKWLSLHTVQHWYAPILYGFLAVKFRINDFIILLFSKKNGVIRVNPPTAYDWINFWTGKLFFAFWRYWVPMMVFHASFVNVIWMNVLTDAVCSYILAFVFQVSHVADFASWPRIDPTTKKVNMDWAALQLATTRDYAHGNRLVTFLTGALNYQCIHHLFPGVSQYHYMAIGPIVRDTAKEFGVPFHHLDTFSEAFFGHWDYLRKMGAAGKTVHMD